MHPARSINLNVFGLIFPLLTFATIVALLLFYKKSPKWLVIIALVLIVGGIYELRKYIQIDILQPPVEQSESLTIMSYNTMMGLKMVNNKRKVTPKSRQALNDLLHQDQSVDVLCAQEVSDFAREAITEIGQLPYVHQIGGRSAAIFSKYPIINKGALPFGKKVNSCLWADIATPHDTLRIYSAHLESIRLDRESYSMLTDDQEYERDKAIRGLKDMMTKYHKYAIVRSEQVDMVKESIAKSPHPVILCGDFNDPPMSYTYQELSEQLDDAFISCGAGIGSTWIGHVPMLRIDYILSDPELECVRYRTITSSLSDHYPIKAVFDMK